MLWWQSFHLPLLNHIGESAREWVVVVLGQGPFTSTSSPIKAKILTKG